METHYLPHIPKQNRRAFAHPAESKKPTAPQIGAAHYFVAILSVATFVGLIHFDPMGWAVAYIHFDPLEVMK